MIKTYLVVNQRGNIIKEYDDIHAAMRKAWLLDLWNIVTFKNDRHSVDVNIKRMATLR